MIFEKVIGSSAKINIVTRYLKPEGRHLEQLTAKLLGKIVKLLEMFEIIKE